MELRNLDRCTRCSSLMFLLLVCLVVFDTRHQFQAVSPSEVNHFPSPNEEVYENPEYDDSLNQMPPLGHLFSLDSDEFDLDSYKRSSAFFPLRGKKPSTDQAGGDFPPEGNPEDKRASHFFPLRGKKIPDELKRASSFMPMRGRKDDGELYGARDDDKRASSFMPMRGKKRSGGADQLGKSGTYPREVVNDARYPHGSKRRSAFVPVRGRKGDQSTSEYDSSDKLPDSVNQDHAHESVKYVNVSTLRLRKRSAVPSSTSSHRVFLVDSDMMSPGHVVTGLIDKRAPSSFMPMRGRRKSLDSSKRNGTEESGLDARLVKRASSFMPMRGKKTLTEDFQLPSELQSTSEGKTLSGSMDSTSDQQIQYDAFQSPINIIPASDKRTNSFMAMRGRRLWEKEVGGPEASYITDDKRASSFMPMRGRRLSIIQGEAQDGVSSWTDRETAYDSRNGQSNKRASSFMPMRGRRYQNDVNSPWMEDDEESKTNLKRASSFMPMRGRRYQNDVNSPWMEDDSESSTSLKRASSFMPMRGRRYQDEVDSPWMQDDSKSSTSLKRASSFMPMRGRRMLLSYDSSSSSEDESDSSTVSKRASSFMPMRGRRFQNNDLNPPWSEDVRSTLGSKRRSSFMPMSGRRFQNNDLSPPWSEDYKRLSSFMPMRGRRLNKDIGSHWTESTSEEMDDSKRASSFMPMRGRRRVSDLGETSQYYSPYPYLLAGIGSSLMRRPYGDKRIPLQGLRGRKRRFKINWDSVKRAFHATRGKRVGEMESTSRKSYFMGTGDSSSLFPETVSDSGRRTKRNIHRSRLSVGRQMPYIALKRPMSFFATRGKRLDGSSPNKMLKRR